MHDTACPLLRLSTRTIFDLCLHLGEALSLLFGPEKRRRVSVRKLLESSLTAEFLDFAHLFTTRTGQTARAYRARAPVVATMRLQSEVTRHPLPSASITHTRGTTYSTTA